MAGAGVASPAIWCRIIATAAFALAAAAYADEKPKDKPKEKPNRIERTAQKAADGTERTAKRAGKFVEKDCYARGQIRRPNRDKDRQRGQARVGIEKRREPAARAVVSLPMEQKPRWAEMCARILQQCEVLRGGRSEPCPLSWRPARRARRLGRSKSGPPRAVFEKAMEVILAEHDRRAALGPGPKRRRTDH